MDEYYDDYDDYDEEPMCYECAYCNGCWCDFEDVEIDPNDDACPGFRYY